MKTLIHDETSIHYVVAGSQLPTLLFVHGSNIDLTYWDAQVAYFSDRCKVIAIDLPGHGKSGRDKPHWTVKGLGEDVASFMKSLELEQVILIGHSMGGDVNLVAVTTCPEPVIGFISIDFFKQAGQPLSPEFQQQSKQIIYNLHHDFANTDEQYARMALLTPQTPGAVTERVVQNYRRAYQPMVTALTEEIFTNVYKIEQELLPKLPCKLHLINVDYIPTMPTNEGPLQQYVTAGYEVHHMAGTSHYPMIENPDEFNRQLDATIKQIIQENKEKF